MKVIGRMTLFRNGKTYQQRCTNKKKLFLLEEKQIWPGELTGNLFCSTSFKKKNKPNSGKHFFLQYFLKVIEPSNGISPMDVALDTMPELSKIKSSCSMDFCLWVDKIPSHLAEQNVGRIGMGYLGKRDVD